MAKAQAENNGKHDALNSHFTATRHESSPTLTQLMIITMGLSPRIKSYTIGLIKSGAG